MEMNVVIGEGSERLQVLRKFEKWDGETPRGCPVLIKVKGKCSECSFVLWRETVLMCLPSYRSYLRWWSLAQISWSSREYLTYVRHFIHHPPSTIHFSNIHSPSTLLHPHPIQPRDSLTFAQRTV